MNREIRARRAAPPLRNATSLLAIALCACATSPGHDERGLADAERAFARLAADVGVRDAFVASFAPDGLVFEPAPVRVRDAWPARPAPPQPAPQRLAWQPELVVVASSGDLGFSTGPFRVEDRASGEIRAHGAYFSVWQRGPGEPWRVWLDMGARLPAPVDPATWSIVPRPDAPGTPGVATVDAVLAQDRALSGLDAAAFGASLAVDARQHRDGRVPLLQREWVAALARTGATASYEPVEARIARAGDLAAVHGRVVWRAGGTDTAARYVHVWLRNGGPWRLAVETLVDER